MRTSQRSQGCQSTRPSSTHVHAVVTTTVATANTRPL